MLVDDQRAFARVCLAASPPEEDLAALGAMRERWLLYRHMVRTRLRGMVATGLRRTVEALGEERYGTLFSRWLDESPPRSRFIREVVVDFGQFAEGVWAAEPEPEPWLSDLVRYERTRWEVGYIDGGAPDVDEFHFEGQPVLDPTVRLIRLGHPVHRALAEDEGSYPSEPVHLCLFRGGDDRTSLIALNDFAGQLLEGFVAAPERTVTETVRALAGQHGWALDEALVTKLGTVLADLLEKGVVLGSEPQKSHH